MHDSQNDRIISWADLANVGREEIRALHLTWIAFFLTFFVWFNMAPLATTIVRTTNLSLDQIKLLAICNVALAVPGRVIIEQISNRLGPRRTFSIVMVAMSLPCIVFAFGTSYMEFLVSRLLLGMVGTGFVVGIHMTSLWFRPRDVGFAQGVEAGFGNWGASIAAMTLPVVALTLFHGEQSWRYVIALTGVVMFTYGVYYWIAITDGPVGASAYKPAKAAPIQVSSWSDLVRCIILTVPIMGILLLLALKIAESGFISPETTAVICLTILAIVIFQIIQILRVNLPKLKKGVPESDQYRFTDVVTLSICYVTSFGAELAVISMLPMFFENTFVMTPQMAGVAGALFAFLNFFSRALGGYLSDKMSSRKIVMLFYLAGIAITFFILSLVDSSWPLFMVIIAVLVCSVFTTGGCGATFAMVPLIKRSMTGQISGYVGAYGNVGAIVYLTFYTFVSDSQLFIIIGLTALVAFLICCFGLREPESKILEEYHFPSINKTLIDENST